MHTIEVPAGVIDYDETGSGPPVVLLHGLLMDHTLWDRVLPLLPGGFRYVRPVLPLGAHRRAMNPGADLTLSGQVALVADFLDALSLQNVTLVHSDWGGALFLTARGLDHRVTRQLILPCEAFGNFPPGLPGKMLALAVRLPAGVQLAARQLRIGWLRRLPLLYGQMARRPVPDELIRRWTEPVLSDPDIRRDLLAYCRGKLDKAALIRDTEALRRFQGDALVLWSPDNKVMPPAHGHQLATLIPRARYAEIPGAYVLSMLDEPEAVAREMGNFLTSNPRPQLVHGQVPLDRFRPGRGLHAAGRNGLLIPASGPPSSTRACWVMAPRQGRQLRCVTLRSRHWLLLHEPYPPIWSATWMPI